MFGSWQAWQGYLLPYEPGAYLLVYCGLEREKGGGQLSEGQRERDREMEEERGPGDIHSLSS